MNWQVLICLVATVMIIWCLIKLLDVLTTKHKWVYRNPYDRTCEKCGQHEVEHCWSMESWNRGFWEIFKDGDGSCQKKSK